MQICTTTQARERLFSLIDEVNASHTPVFIAGKRNQAVLMAKEDYDAMMETMYIMSVPGLGESILAGQKEPIENFLTEID